jgi:hypothetical protein
MLPPNGWRVTALAWGLLSSLPASAVELHLDAAAWHVPAFNLPVAKPLQGLQDWQLSGAFQSNQSSKSLALISIAGAAPLAVRPGELIAEGISLQAVYSDHVRVERGDRQALLYLRNAVDAASDTAHPPSLPITPAGPPPSAECLSLQTQVPLEELATLGICPH